MKSKQRGEKKSWLFWTPRILMIGFILFLSLFSLDIFDEKLGFWGTILGLIMHNIPSFIMIALLVLAWKHEWVGGFFILPGLAYMIMARNAPFMWSLTIAGPAIAIGLMFLIPWLNRKKVKNKMWILLAIYLLIASVAVYSMTGENTTVIGGETDEHGCLGPAGYSWNETEGKCVREWETNSSMRYQNP